MPPRSKKPSDMETDTEPKTSTSPLSAKSKNKPAEPLASPVLHGLKLGCKRKNGTPASLSGPGKMHRRVSATDDSELHLPYTQKRATLILSDGSRHVGYSFGAETSTSGEVVFNTAMVGYPESLTDPSYRGQILTLTYPLIGNYGVPPDEKDDLGLPAFFESSAIHITALLVSDYSTDSCHWNQVTSLGSWLKEHNVPALCGIDTRALTKVSCRYADEDAERRECHERPPRRMRAASDARRATRP